MLIIMKMMSLNYCLQVVVNDPRQLILGESVLDLLNFSSWK
jgi:hypothetical protein